MDEMKKQMELQLEQMNVAMEMEMEMKQQELEQGERDHDEVEQALALMKREDYRRMRFNVGGQMVSVSLGTLMKDPDCLFTRIVNDDEIMRDDRGVYFIDRDARLIDSVMSCSDLPVCIQSFHKVANQRNE